MSGDYYDPHPTLSLDQPLALVGHPGAGVAHVARAISGRTGLPFNDVPRIAEALAGSSRSRLVVEQGVDALRDVEARALASALRRQPYGVIVVESSLLEHADCLEQVGAEARTVYLRRPEVELLRRIRAQCEAAPGSMPEFMMEAPRDLASLRAFLAPAETQLERLDTIFDAHDEHASLIAEKLLASLDRLMGVAPLSR